MKEVIIIKSFRKNLIMFFVLILIILLTLNSIYDKESIKLIITGFPKIKLEYILIGFGLMISYYLLYGYYLKYTFGLLNIKVPFLKGVFYGLVEFYFSGITPSATGGQPVQMYYMSKDKIPIKNSYITLLINTMFFKIAIIILGILALFFKQDIIQYFKPIHMDFFYFGLICDILFCLLLAMFLFNSALIKRTLKWIFKFFKRFHIFKKYTDRDVDEIVGDYKEDLTLLLTNKSKFLYSLFLVFIVRIIYFSVAYVVYKGLGLSGYGYLDMLAIQVSVQMAIEMVPIPGGSYVSEKMFFYIFSIVFLIEYASLGMLLTRAFIFYIPIVVTGIIIFIYNIVNKVRDFF